MKSKIRTILLLTIISIFNFSAWAQSMKTIVQLTNPNVDSFWYPLTDQLRFGEKGSTAFMSVNWEKGLGSFFGELKINQGAGFASYRTNEQLNLTDFNQIQIPVLGDGRRYKVLLKDKQAKASSLDYSYQAEFATTPGEFKNIVLKFEDFKPIVRGKIDLTLPAMNRAEIEELGLQINDKIQGSFHLEFKDWVATP